MWFPPENSSVYHWLLETRKINGGIDPLEQWSALSGQVPNGTRGDFEQFTAKLHSHFRYFTFSGKISKYDPLENTTPWKNVTLPAEKFNFYPGWRINKHIHK